MLLSSERGESNGILPMVVMGAIVIGLFLFIATTAASPFAAFTGGSFGFSNAPQVKTFKMIMNATPSGPANTSLRFDSPGYTKDPSNDPNSTFKMDIVLATSIDGKTFSGEKSILDHAIPATASIQSGGRIIVYGIDGAGRAASGYVMATTDNNGRFWRRGSLRISSPINSIFKDIDAVNTSNINIRLFYLGATSGTKDHPIQNIYSAISHDGINFTEESGIRYSDTDISNPDVLFYDGLWTMHLKKNDQIITTVSDDGNTFTMDSILHDANDPIRSVGINSKESRIFYCYEGIRTAASDGFSWEDEEGVKFSPDLPSGCPIAPIKTSSQWMLFYPKLH
jgi:hypothetical protein